MEHNIEQEARPAAVRVLIADKNATLREDLREALENAGYEVIGEAANGVEAVLAAQKLHPHLVISDTYLPKQDGIAAAEIILRERIAPVILLTAQSDVEAVRRAARIGVHSYLVRPLHEAALIPAIEVALGTMETAESGGKAAGPPAKAGQYTGHFGFCEKSIDGTFRADRNGSASFHSNAQHELTPACTGDCGGHSYGAGNAAGFAARGGRSAGAVTRSRPGIRSH